MRIAPTLAVLTTSWLALGGCYQAIDCGSFLVERDGACACPPGSMFEPEPPSCRLMDGGTVLIGDGGVPDGCTPETFFRDVDDDGFGDAASSMTACSAPDGYVDNAEDCDDACATCYPGAAEACNGVDDDCNGTRDDASPSALACERMSRPNVDAALCSAAECAVSECAMGFCDVDLAFANGCETELGTLAACRSCTEACGWDCDAGGCNDAVMLATGESRHVCAVRELGDVICWGENLRGQVGLSEVSDETVPLARIVDAGPFQVAATGSNHSCALRRDGTLRCWGDNRSGQLGDGTNTPRFTLGTVVARTGVTDPLTTVRGVAAGAAHTCAVLMDGSVRCWGDNSGGQIGDGTGMGRSAPTTVLDLTGATSIAAGQAHTCAIVSDRTVRCWGFNLTGQLGDNSTTTRTRAVAVPGLSDVTALEAGTGHTCALTGAGRVFCWGSNGDGRIGDGSSATERRVPTAVLDLTGVRALGVGGAHACAVLEDGTLRCWGNNAFGQLGDGTTMSASRPVMAATTDVASVACGSTYTCAIRVDGSVVCWGSNESGQLGDGTYTPRGTAAGVVPPTL